MNILSIFIPKLKDNGADKHFVNQSARNCGVIEYLETLKDSMFNMQLSTFI